MNKKFTMKYVKGDLSGVQVIWADCEDQAKLLLDQELLRCHSKLPDKATRVQFVKDQQGRFTPKQKPQELPGKVSPAHVPSDKNS